MFCCQFLLICMLTKRSKIQRENRVVALNASHLEECDLIEATAALYAVTYDKSTLVLALQEPIEIALTTLLCGKK